jgi:hypothetical protein
MAKSCLGITLVNICGVQNREKFKLVKKGAPASARAKAGRQFPCWKNNLGERGVYRPAVITVSQKPAIKCTIRGIGICLDTSRQWAQITCKQNADLARKIRDREAVQGQSPAIKLDLFS